jgi:uncharacterized sulfatase
MRSPKNIVWIVYDSLRADRTSISGYEHPTTPNFQRIASRPSGEAFTNTIAHAIWSLPSSASMLTGTPPSYHNAGLENDVLPEEIPTVPGRLSEHGWRTVGLSGNSYFTEETGLDRGFDEFTRLRTVPLRESNLLSVAGPWTLLKFLLNLNRHSGGYTTDVRRHSANYLVNEIAKRQLTDLYRDDSPFFFYAHFPGAHHPYAPPKPFRDRFLEAYDLPPAAAETAVERTTDIYEEIANGCEFTSTEWEAISAMYDASVAYSDSLAGDLFDHIERHSDGETVVVLTADHGDLLGEQDLLSHKLVLHDAVVNVPMVVYGLPELVGRSTDVVQHTDVMRTLLQRFDVPTDGMNGHDLSHSAREFAVTQRGAATYENTLETLNQYDTNVDTDRFGDGLVTAVRTNQFKLVDYGDRKRLYRLPDEDVDVSDRYPEKRSQLEAWLEQWQSDNDERVSTSDATNFSAGAKQRLRDLGYVVE